MATLTLCKDVYTEEYKVYVLGNSSFWITFFCALCHPKVSLALKIFIDVQENLIQFNSKLKIVKEYLSKVITDLNSKTRESNANSDIHATKLNPSVLDKKFNFMVNGIKESRRSTKNTYIAI